MNKKYKKYTSITDRFPFIIFTIIIVIAVIFILRFSAKFTFPFFSGNIANGTLQTQNSTQQTSQTQDYPMLISSPTDNEDFTFENGNETIPIKIDSKVNIANTSYKINIVLSDGQIIKTLSSQPYEYDWNPILAGNYSIVATLVDANDHILSSSNMVKFTVEYQSSTSNNEISSSADTSNTSASTALVDHSVTIDLQIVEGPTYSSNGDIYYYRVRAIVTGDPTPKVVFSKDDSNGTWGASIAQVNLSIGKSYNLGAIASNAYDSKNSNIKLTAPKSKPKK